MDAYQYTLEMAVRDYECDMQGVVNNARYMNYLEHARHEFFKSLGADFAEITARGIHLVVTRAELDYKRSLRSGDAFVVGLNLERESRLRFVFRQDIFRLPDHEVMLKGRIMVTSLNERGRPAVVAEVEELFGG